MDGRPNRGNKAAFSGKFHRGIVNGPTTHATCVQYTDTCLVHICLIFNSVPN